MAVAAAAAESFCESFALRAKPKKFGTWLAGRGSNLKKKKGKEKRKRKRKERKKKRGKRRKDFVC